MQHHLQNSAFVLLAAFVLSLDSTSVRGPQFSNAQQQPQGTISRTHLTEYLLQRLLGSSSEDDNRQAERKAVEDKIFSGNNAQLVFSRDRGVPIRRYLDEAKEQIDVIDFHKPLERSDNVYFVRRPRQNSRQKVDEDLQFGDDFVASASSQQDGRASKDSAASEQVPVKLAFPGNEYKRPKRSQMKTGCTNCVDGGTGPEPSRWTMPLQKLGEKQYYLGIFFKANWYKAEQYCRFHGMHLASINSAEEQRDLQDHIQAYGMGHEHFWTSGTDQGEEGKFFWMGTGKPITYQNWNAGEPNNFEYEDGEQEHCLEMWDRDGKGLGWNDTPCSFATFFICEA